MTWGEILFGSSGFIMLGITVMAVFYLTRWQDERELRRSQPQPQRQRAVAPRPIRARSRL